MTLKIEAGRFYRTRDGRRVGPLKKEQGNEPFGWRDGNGGDWSNEGIDGLAFGPSENPEPGDLIAEWTEDRPHMTLPNGDVLYEDEYGVNRARQPVGPMRRNGSSRWPWSDAKNQSYCDGGQYFSDLHKYHNCDYRDIIAKWRDEAETPTPETGTLRELNVKPGDVVECLDEPDGFLIGSHMTIREDGVAVASGGGMFNPEFDQRFCRKYRIISRAAKPLPHGHADKPDLINHPHHYTSHPSGVECLTITRHMGFNLGNAMKYIRRADLKGNAVDDLRKAAFYIADEIAKREADK